MVVPHLAAPEIRALTMLKCGVSVVGGGGVSVTIRLTNSLPQQDPDLSGKRRCRERERVRYRRGKLRHRLAATEQLRRSRQPALQRRRGLRLGWRSSGSVAARGCIAGVCSDSTVMDLLWPAASSCCARAHPGVCQLGSSRSTAAQLVYQCIGQNVSLQLARGAAPRLSARCARCPSADAHRSPLSAACLDRLDLAVADGGDHLRGVAGIESLPIKCPSSENKTA